MNGQNILDFFYDLIDDNPSEDFSINLMNHAKDLIEADRDWQMLIKEDSTKVIASGDTYLTAKALPSDFVNDLKVSIGSETDDSYLEYLPIGFRDRRVWKDSQRYYVDYANDNLYICGSNNAGETIYLYYIYQTDDLTVSTSPVWPAKFHKLIAFLMAELHQSGIDVDELVLRQALAQNKQAILLFNAMKNWDTKLALRTMGNSSPIQNSRFGKKTNVIPFN